MGYGGGGFLSEAGLRERAQAQGRVFGAGGGGSSNLGFLAFIEGGMHSYVTLADDAPRGFGALFWPPLHGIGTPGSGFRT